MAVATETPPLTLGVDGYWLPVKDGDDRARALFLRHYSARPERRKQRPFNALFAGGAGTKMVLLTGRCDALFVWFQPPWGFQAEGQHGVNCAIFRNESPIRSSDLIREAMALAWARWPRERLFTYVNPSKIRSVNPGACFKFAGWRACGVSKGGLVILEVLP